VFITAISILVTSQEQPMQMITLLIYKPPKPDYIENRSHLQPGLSMHHLFISVSIAALVLWAMMALAL
jgi:hypothetical protein